MDIYRELNNSSVYVIDKEFRIQYFNDAILKIFPNLRCGDYCYQSLCGKDSVCSGCPAVSGNKNNGMFYNHSLGCWVSVNSARVDWPGSGAGTLIMSKVIAENNKNLVCDLTEISAYDELYELNLTKGTYSMLYNQAGQYVLPPRQGSINELKQMIYNRMLFFEDHRTFYALWKPLTAEQPSLQYLAGKVVRGQFRRLMISGEYSWVEQIIIPLNREGSTDVIVMVFLQDIDKQEHTIDNKVDSLTGLYQRHAFFREAQLYLEKNENSEYCLMAVDIEHFKLFNEWYGAEEGDRFLIKIGSYLKSLQEEGNGVAGYMGSDDFCIVMPRHSAVISRLQEQVIREAGQYGGNAGFLPAFGLYAIEPGDELHINTMYDRAAIAVAAVRGNYARRSCWYASHMMEAIKEDHILLAEVQKALDEEQFLIYLQPQCNMSTGKVIGFESLVRWKHPERGMILPDGFIRVLEKHGFIANLDRYMWDKVCAQIRSWLDQGLCPVPISVNVSRIDLYTMDVAECFSELIKKYDLDPKYVEIEITESAYVEEYQMIAKVVENLKRVGFLVLMDDFGSGYSSLNMLKDVNVDVIKLDMKFLNMNEQSVGRGMGILDAITSMARFMDLQLIAEGVETREQVMFLLDMGCLCGQGYYFYRPMPVEACEGLLYDYENLDFSGVKAQHMDRLNVKELLNGDTFSEITINNILGGIAIYDVCDECITLLQMNEPFYRIVGFTPEQLEECRGMLEQVEEEDQERLLEAFKKARRDLLYGAEVDIRFVKADTSIIWLHIRLFFMRKHEGHLLFYGAASDITAQKSREQQIEESQQALSSMMPLTDQNESYQQLDEERQRSSEAQLAQMSSGGLYGSYLEDGYPVYFINDGMLKLLGYDDYHQFSEASGGTIANLIHVSDRRQVLKAIGFEYQAGFEYTTSYRIRKESGRYVWVLDKSKVIQTVDGRLAVVSACVDISEPILVQRQLSEWNDRLMKQNQQMQFVNNDIPGGYYRCEATPDMDFLHISNRFLEIFGYSRNQIRELFDDKGINLIHPDDRKIVTDNMTHFKNYGKGYNQEYRMLSRIGYIWIIAQNQFIQSGGKHYLQSIVLDMTETVELRNQMTMLAEYMPENIALVTYSKNRCRYQILTDGLFRHLGYQPEVYEEWITGGRYHDVIAREDFVCIDERIKAEFEARRDCEGVFEVCFPDGLRRWLKLNAKYIKESANGILYLCIYGDVSEIKQDELEVKLLSEQMELLLQQEEVLTRMAERDPLTGLYNRRGAMPMIRQYLESAAQEPAALLIFDLDNFKMVNEVWGHLQGDKIISQNAEKLSGFFREGDIICRLGGDEFMVLCKGIAEKDLTQRLKQVIRSMKVTVEIEGKTLVFTISAGYAMIPRDGRELSELYRRADIALFGAKADGKSMYRAYDPSMKEMREELAYYKDERD